MERVSANSATESSASHESDRARGGQSSVGSLAMSSDALDLINLSKGIHTLNAAPPSVGRKGLMGNLVKKLSFERKPAASGGGSEDGTRVRRFSFTKQSQPLENLTLQVPATADSTNSTDGALDLIALSSQINSLQTAPLSSEKRSDGVVGSLVKKLSFERKPRPSQAPQVDDASAPNTAAPTSRRRFSFTKQPLQPPASENLHQAQVAVAVESGGSPGAFTKLVRKLSFSKQKVDQPARAAASPSASPSAASNQSTKAKSHPLAAGAFVKLPLSQVPTRSYGTSSGESEAALSPSGSDAPPGDGRSPRLSLSDFESLVAGGSAPPPPAVPPS